METAIKTSIEVLAKQVTKDVKPCDALQYTQAALNLAHVLGTLANIGDQKS